MIGIGDKLKALRSEKGLTMDLFVADMNAKFPSEKTINKSMVSRWENNENDPTLENAKNLSIYFDVNLDYLIGISNVRMPSRLLELQQKSK